MAYGCVSACGQLLLRQADLHGCEKQRDVIGVCQGSHKRHHAQARGRRVDVQREVLDQWISHTCQVAGVTIRVGDCAGESVSE